MSHRWQTSRDLTFLWPVLLCKEFFGIPQNRDSAWPTAVRICSPHIRNSPKTFRNDWMRAVLQRKPFHGLFGFLWQSCRTLQVPLPVKTQPSLIEDICKTFLSPLCLCFSWQSLTTLSFVPEQMSPLQAFFSTLSNTSLELKRLNLMTSLLVASHQNHPDP